MFFYFFSLGVFGGAKAVRPACIAAPFRLNPERRLFIGLIIPLS